MAIVLIILQRRIYIVIIEVQRTKRECGVLILSGLILLRIGLLKQEVGVDRIEMTVHVCLQSCQAFVDIGLQNVANLQELRIGRQTHL